MVGYREFKNSVNSINLDWPCEFGGNFHLGIGIVMFETRFFWTCEKSTVALLLYLQLPSVSVLYPLDPSHKRHPPWQTIFLHNYYILLVGCL